MKKINGWIFMVVLVALVSGCFSPAVYSQSKQKVALRKAIISNNQAAIQAIKLGDDGVGLGIDVTKLEALKEQPLKQAAAAIGDALLIWGGYEGVRWAGDQIDNGGSKSSSRSTTAGRDANDVIINGDGNTVDIGDKTMAAPESASGTPAP